MKKTIFTLVLVLSIAVSGFAQVRMASKSDALKNVATKQIFNGSESLKYVAGETPMTRTDGELDYTIYDWQTNAASRNWTIMWDDGKINFAFTCATDESFSTRGTAIGTYDAVNDVWTPSGGRIENEKTGFGSIARYGENGIVVVAHTASNCGVYIIPDKDNITPNSYQAVSYLDNTYSPTWPVVQTSGANRDIIHIMATASEQEIDGITEPIIYFRSQDGGQTWDKQNEIIPNLNSSHAITFSSNDCYFMETVESCNRLSLVVNSAWCDGKVIYSEDDGETWDEVVYYAHPGYDQDFTDITFIYPRWVSAQWDSNMKLHIVYEFNGSTGVPGSGSYYPGLGGVAYWSELMPLNPNAFAVGIAGEAGQPFVMDSTYLNQDIFSSWYLYSDCSHNNEMFDEYIGFLPALDENDQPIMKYEDITEWAIEDMTLHGAYNSGVCAMPVLCVDPFSNEMVAVWVAMNEHNKDGNGNHFYRLFAAYSDDFGATWSDQKQITTDFMFQLSEFTYPQAVLRNGQLIIAVQMDEETGTYVQGDESNSGNNLYYGLTFNINDIFGGTADVNEVIDNNTTMRVYPSPATEKLNVTLSNNSRIVIYNITGQVINTIDGQAGVNTINVSSLSSGVYFISAGNHTQKFIIK